MKGNTFRQLYCKNYKDNRKKLYYIDFIEPVLIFNIKIVHLPVDRWEESVESELRDSTASHVIISYTRCLKVRQIVLIRCNVIVSFHIPTIFQWMAICSFCYCYLMEMDNCPHQRSWWLIRFLNLKKNYHFLHLIS